MTSSAEALSSEVDQTLRRLGVESLRASVIDVRGMFVEDAWSIGEQGTWTTVREGHRTLDSAYPGAALTLMQLEQAGPEDVISHKLSPRLWVFAWRLDALRAVMAETRYSQPQPNAGDRDKAVVRVLCQGAIQAARRAGAPELMPGTEALSWSASMAAGGAHPRALPLALGLSLTASLLGLWLVAVDVPAEAARTASLRADHQRLSSLNERVAAQAVAVALEHDYGEAQDVLTNLMKLGLAPSAVVLNTAGKVVAREGDLVDTAVGGTPRPDWATRARSLDLEVGTKTLGRLLLGEGATVAPMHEATSTWRALPLLMAAASLAASALLATWMFAPALRRWVRGRA